MLREEYTAPLEGDEQKPMQDRLPPGDKEAVHPFQGEHDFWIKRAKDALSTSTSFLESEHIAQWQKNQDNFDSKHPAGSKYYTDAYKHRSRIFRPKIRAAESKGESAFAEAMFGSSEIITVNPADEGSKEDAVMAEVWQAIMNWRIKKDIPWYKISIGAFQTTWIRGIAISRQDWEYEEEEYVAQGGVYSAGQVQRRVRKSRPRITLIDPLMFRFDPGADWVDPIGSSPYLIEIIPMYLDELMRFMASPITKGREDAWIGATEGEVLSANKDYLFNLADSDRRQKASESSDSFETIWVHRNIIQDKDGVDHEFYTVGADFMLSWPVPLDSPIGRNYVIGVSNVEVFKAIPASRIQLAEMIQAEANDMVNQQLDNVKLALNRGYMVRRDKNVDLNTLRRSYPGRIVMTDDLDAIRPEQLNDVTSSSYIQQDRLNNDMDDIVGGFSQGSVATNANLNRTVGGMQMLQSSSNAVTGYIVRTFVETWIEPVLGQVLRLTQEYEEESVIRKFAGDKEIDLNLDMILKSMSVVVSVGFGNLDPKLRVQTLVTSLQTSMGIAPQLAAKIDEDAVLAELTAVAGYRDGSRFLLSGEQVQERQAQAQEAAAQQGGGAVELEQQKLQLEAQKLAIEQQKLQIEAQIDAERLSLQRELGFAKIAAQENITMQQLEQRLGVDLAKADLNEREFHLRVAELMGKREDIKKDREEMMLKERMGSGI